MYSLNPSLYNSVFVVPSTLVDKYIKMASFSAVKSLLWILKNQGGNFSIEEISKNIGSSTLETQEALDYWVNEGILISSGTVTIPSSAPISVNSDSYLAKKETEPKSAVINSAQTKTIEEIKISKPTVDQILKRMDEDAEIKSLFNQVQIIIGRSFGFDLQSTLLMMYDTYGINSELILMLVQYCVDIGKSSTAFINSVAKSWYEQDICNVELANQYIEEHNKVFELFSQFAALTGISNPRPTPSQTKYLISWMRLGFSVDMIVLAYNETAEHTGKINFKYTDKILQSWHESGLKTPEDVQKSREEYKAKNKKSIEKNNSYDIDKAVFDAENKPIKFERKQKKRG